jgi:hypothetical protein
MGMACPGAVTDGMVEDETGSGRMLGAHVVAMGADGRGVEMIRLGDERTEVDDWRGAVSAWRAAAASGADDAAGARLRAFVRRFGPAAAEAAEGAGVPRRALQPLVICVEAALLGVLAMIAANRVDGGPDTILLWLGWLGFAVSGGSAVVFAGRSGKMDGGRTAPAVAETADLETIGARAEAIAAGMEPTETTSG